MNWIVRTLVAIVPLVAACAGGSTGPADCRPGETIGCACADGRTGVGSCGTDACACEPVTALTAEPQTVDFGEVPRGTSREVVVLLRSRASREVRLGAGVLDGGAGAFSLPDGFPSAIPAGASVPVVVRFTAAEPGARAARLRVEPDDAGLAPVEVALSVVATGPTLVCTPAEVAFPDAWAGLPSTTTVTCANAGSDPARLHIDRVEVTGDGFSATWPMPPLEGLLLGEDLAIDVTLDSVAAGAREGSLVVHSDGGAAAIRLSGRAAETPACDVEVPDAIQFGPAFAGQRWLETLVLRNRRADAPCAVRDLRLCAGSDPALSLPERPAGPAVLAPHGELRVPVLLLPAPDSCAAPGSDGCIEFQLSPSPDGHRSVPLSCVPPPDPHVLEPSELDFGIRVVGCPEAERQFQLQNHDVAPVTVVWIEPEEGTSDEFTVSRVGVSGVTIEPGEFAAFTVTYRPRDQGEDVGAVLLRFGETLEERRIPLRGAGGPPPFQRDSFRQNNRSPLDVLLVIDNGASMAAEATKLVPELGGLPQWLEDRRIDYRLAVTTTGRVAGGAGCPGGANGGEDGRFFPVDGTRPRVLDATTPDLQAAWEANLAVGSCHDAPPETLEAAYLALASPLATEADDPRHPQPNDGNLGFLRDNAYLWIVAISDRADASPGTDGFYFNAIASLKGRGMLGPTLIAITGARSNGCTAADGRAAAPGDRLIGFADRFTFGDFASICGADWRSVLPAYLGPRTCFFLGNLPTDWNANGVIDVGDELRVLVDGVEVPSTIDGAEVWRWEANPIAVCFAPGHVPGPGVAIDVEYLGPVCEW